jgi:hypothetical protein
MRPTGKGTGNEITGSKRVAGQINPLDGFQPPVILTLGFKSDDTLRNNLTGNRLEPSC